MYLISIFITVKQINCDLWLQMALYFNFYYSIVWICFHFLTILSKVIEFFFVRIHPFSNLFNLIPNHLQYNTSFDLGLFLKFTTLTIVSIIESPRIYLGYLGNLQSQILCCVGFWLLTLLIQIPIITFLLCSRLVKFSSFEIIMHFILYIFHLIELFFGFSLVRNLIIDAI